MSEERIAAAGENLESSRRDLYSKLLAKIAAEAEAMNRKRKPIATLRWCLVYNTSLEHFDVVAENSTWPLGATLFFDKMDAMSVLVVYAEKLKTLYAVPSKD